MSSLAFAKSKLTSLNGARAHLDLASPKLGGLDQLVLAWIGRASSFLAYVMAGCRVANYRCGMRSVEDEGERKERRKKIKENKNN